MTHVSQLDINVGYETLVDEFHRAFGLPIRYGCHGFDAFDYPDQVELRLNLIQEEFNELKQALYAKDTIEVADALGDMIYVVVGAAITFGIPLSAVVQEIHESNMTKLGEDGNPIYRPEDGKVMKGPNFRPPNLRSILPPQPEQERQDA